MSAGPFGTLPATLGMEPSNPPPPNITTFEFQVVGNATLNRIFGAVLSTGEMPPLTRQYSGIAAAPVPLGATTNGCRDGAACGRQRDRRCGDRHAGELCAGQWSRGRRCGGGSRGRIIAATTRCQDAANAKVPRKDQRRFVSFMSSPVFVGLSAQVLRAV